jgi:hypothetical protein
MYYYRGLFGNTILYFGFKYKKTADYFDGWLTESSQYDSCIEIPQRDFDYYQNTWSIPESPYTEYSLSVYRACEELLKHDSCILHGAAFLWHGGAYIFSAPSGTGKSTQLRNWMELYGDEITVINGDKPILVHENEKIVVYPSPWNGKEKMGSRTLTAELKGIILLAQSKENTIRKLTPLESADQLFQRVLFTVETEESVYLASDILTEILSSVPVWKLNNTGDHDSSILTCETLKEELNNAL